MSEHSSIPNDADLEKMIKAELPKIYNLCLRLCQNQEDASDLCQDSFVRAIKGLRKFRGDSKISTWLYRVTVNTWKNRVRSEKRRFRNFHFSLFGQNHADEDKQRELELEEDQPTPDEAIQLKEDQREIFKSLNKLEPDEKTIVVLRDIEDRTYEDIASVLDINEGTVKSRLSRARQHLREIHLRTEGKIS